MIIVSNYNNILSVRCNLSQHYLSSCLFYFIPPTVGLIITFVYKGVAHHVYVSLIEIIFIFCYILYSSE